MNQLEAIDEAVNLLMDYHLRPHFLIEDTDQDLDDNIYSYVHAQMHELIDNVKRSFDQTSSENRNPQGYNIFGTLPTLRLLTKP